MISQFIPVGAPVHRRRLSRLETALVARRYVLEIIPALSYRQPIVSGEMLSPMAHTLADSRLHEAGQRRWTTSPIYPKSEIMRRMLRPAIGDSLFNADGAEWKWQRQAVAPVFTHRNVLMLAPAMTATAERACRRLTVCGGQAELVSEMLTATFDVICDVALSGREHFDSATFSRAITQYFRTAGRASLLDFLGFPEWFPRPGALLAGSSVRTMHSMVAGAIEARRRHSNGPADDLLSYMLAAKDPETGRRMTAEVTLSSTCSSSSSPAMTNHRAGARLGIISARKCARPLQERARVQAGKQLSGRAAGPEDLEAMPLVGRILEEAMRLYPPVGLLRTGQILAGRMNCAAAAGCGPTISPFFP